MGHSHIIVEPHGQSDSWLVCRLRRHQVNVNLICFPHAGGGASFFRRWHEYCPADVEIDAVQLPARENRLTESPCHSFEVLIAAVASAILRNCRAPFAFFGHSMGALISYEVTRYIGRHSSRLPVCLFVSAQPAPNTGWNGLGTHNYSDELLAKEMERLAGTPSEILGEAGALAVFLRTFRADLQLLESYTYAPDLQLRCPIVVFGGNCDPTVGVADLAEWRSFTTDRFALHTFHGGHFYLRDCLPTILEIIIENIKSTTLAQGLPMSR